jgi:hypothetical protein
MDGESANVPLPSQYVAARAVLVQSEVWKLSNALYVLNRGHPLSMMHPFFRFYRCT